MLRPPLIITYHAVEAGPPPLWIDPCRFRAQLDCLRDSRVQMLTVGELAAALVEHRVPDRAVAITFDDGMRSVVDQAAPLLLERGMRATIYCVAGRLGLDNSWPSQPARTPRCALADAGSLSELAAAGFEIGSHGMTHLPLHGASPAQLRHEIVDSRHQLEQLVGAPVSSFAYPYGALPQAEGRALVRSAYSAACAARPAYVGFSEDLFALPRVDIHYLRHPILLSRAARGSSMTYIRMRRDASRIRRSVRKDYALAPVR